MWARPRVPALQWRVGCDRSHIPHDRTERGGDQSGGCRLEGLVQHLWVIFLTVFLAELGDKTQLATLLFAADRQQQPLLIFLAASAALVMSTAVAVLLGTAGAHYLSALPLKLIAGSGFVAIGLWTIFTHFAGS
jgi:putative Ca2+/H+ antiporter (TMEM165/GDT1 family)